MTQAPPPPPSDPNDPLGSPGGSEPPPPPPPPPPVAPSAPPAAPGGYPPPAGADAPPAGYGTAPPPPVAGGYGEQPMGYGAGAAAALPYADWPKRAYGYLIDYFGPYLLALIVTYGINKALGFLVSLAALAWGLYNAYLGGQTGQSYGKKIAGIRLISEATGAPPGGGLGIGRFFVHILDAIPCIPVGFLWPLWDSKRQTFADKILKTVVVTSDAPR
jgi:uncharacterized RDD family membrane protein YckC